MQYCRRRANIAWSNYNVPSYSYRFDVVVNGVADIYAATHFQEVAFVFDNINGDGYSVNPFANKSAAYPALAKTMSNAWVNFVTTLNPNGAAGLSLPGGATWPVYNTTAGGGVGEEIVWSTDGSYIEMDSWRAAGMNWMAYHSRTVFGN
jgi:carboxylesterase type B